MRINAQLVDAASGDHLWAERFDRSLDDIFAVQDEVTGKIVEALLGRLRAPPPRNRPKNLEAYDLCVRARRLIDDSPQTAREAHLMLTRAVSLDPDYAEAYRWLAMNHWMGWAHFGEPKDPTRSVALELARKAVAIDPNDAGCRWVLANLLAYDAASRRRMRNSPRRSSSTRTRPTPGRHCPTSRSWPGGSRRALSTFVRRSG